MKARRILRQAHRLPNSVNGNPRWRLSFEGGTSYVTSPDAADNYNVSESLVGQWVDLEVEGNHVIHINRAS